MEIITPLNNKVSMFATNQELYDELTDKEIITIKLAKLDEFVDDLYRSTTSESNAKLFPPENSFFKIKEILVELTELNC
tara:strand:- start:750 stop:986 length:237 start_codon:yes stop_codon:yes gene_type:complete